MSYLPEAPLGTYNIMRSGYPFYLTQTVSGIEVTESQPQQTLRVLPPFRVIKWKPSGTRVMIHQALSARANRRDIGKASSPTVAIIGQEDDRTA